MADLSDTKRHLIACLRTEIDSPYEFQVPFGQGSVVVQRIRVELSRVKKQFEKYNDNLKKQGKKTETMQRFKLHADIKPMRGDGENAYDLVTLTRSQTDGQRKARSLNHIFKALSTQEESV